MSAPRAAVQLLRMPVALEYAARPQPRGRGRRARRRNPTAHGKGSATVSVAPVGVSPTESEFYDVHPFAKCFQHLANVCGEKQSHKSLISAAPGHILASQNRQKPFQKPSRKWSGSALGPNAPMSDNEKRA